MNGNWFPWSEERNGNHRGEYVQAWRHVHDRFTALGATNVIWIWSPNVITGRPSVRLAPLYPGDDYVDWMGMVGYYRRLYLDDKGNPKPPTFDNTYSGTLDELRSVATKPIVITELGAIEVRQNKAEWIKSLFDGIAANPDIIGFVWFDHSVNGSDWRIESSDAAASAFAEGVASERYGSGHPRRQLTGRHYCPAVRDRFPGLSDGWARFDGPAGTQMVDSAIEAMRAHLSSGESANTHGLFAQSTATTAMVDRTRATVATLIGGDAGGIVFGANMTTLTFALTRSIARTLGPGDEIVGTRLDHDANVTPWRLAARDCGSNVHLRTVRSGDRSARRRVRRRAARLPDPVARDHRRVERARHDAEPSPDRRGRPRGGGQGARGRGPPRAAPTDRHRRDRLRCARDLVLQMVRTARRDPVALP